MEVFLLYFLSFFLAKGDKEVLSGIEQYKQCLKPGGIFKDVELVDGWIATKNQDGSFTWTLREKEEITKDHAEYVFSIVKKYLH